MKLEVGKTYRSRSGIFYAVTKQDGNVFFGTPVDEPTAPLIDWWGDGKYHLSKDCSLDLIEEVKSAPPEPAKPAIPHADLIRAVLDGKTVQIKGPESGKWYDAEHPVNLIKRLLDTEALEFRIKPEPVVRYIPIFDTISGISVIVGDTEQPRRTGGQQAETKEQALFGLNPHDKKLIEDGRHGKLLRLELDPDTLDVISAKTEAP